MAKQLMFLAEFPSLAGHKIGPVAHFLQCQESQSNVTYITNVLQTRVTLWSAGGSSRSLKALR